MSKNGYISDFDARQLRLNRYRREDLTSPKLPKRTSHRIGLASHLAHILEKILRENPAARPDVSRRVLYSALALARAVDEACNREEP